MSYAVLCPGQGAQHPQMLDFIAGNPAAQAVFDEAARALGEDPRAWLRQPEIIFRNAIAQPLICVAELATWTALRGDLPAPTAFAGYSVGELAAYGCAQALDAGELARLARVRAQAMDGAAGERRGGMFATRGLTREAIAALCARRETSIAIATADDAFVVGGTQSALGAFAHEVQQRGAQITCLQISVAAHTPLLAGAVDTFRAALEASALRAPTAPVVAGVDAAWVSTRERAFATLSRQVAATVEWTQCMDALYERGVRLYLELGPGRALSRMVLERHPDVEARAVDEFRSLAAVVAWVTRRVR
jgi:[acyl-carrier-protein] S-malonyltransferase